jgi:hypothetical protein
MLRQPNRNALGTAKFLAVRRRSKTIVECSVAWNTAQRLEHTRSMVIRAWARPEALLRPGRLPRHERRPAAAGDEGRRPT